MVIALAFDYLQSVNAIVHVLFTSDNALDATKTTRNAQRPYGTLTSGHDADPSNRCPPNPSGGITFHPYSSRGLALPQSVVPIGPSLVGGHNGAISVPCKQNRSSRPNSRVRVPDRIELLVIIMDPKRT